MKAPLIACGIGLIVALIVVVWVIIADPFPSVVEQMEKLESPVIVAQSEYYDRIGIFRVLHSPLSDTCYEILTGKTGARIVLGPVACP